MRRVARRDWSGLPGLTWAGAFALGVGADLVDATALREGHLQKITNAARELAEAVRRARGTSTAARAD